MAIKKLDSFLISADWKKDKKDDELKQSRWFVKAHCLYLVECTTEAEAKRAQGELNELLDELEKESA